jgi:hypothetical protein
VSNIIKLEKGIEMKLVPTLAKDELNIFISLVDDHGCTLNSHAREINITLSSLGDLEHMIDKNNTSSLASITCMEA